MARAPNETANLNPALREGRGERRFIHALTLLAGASVLLTLIYWSYRFSTVLTLIVIAIVGIAGWIWRPTSVRPVTPQPFDRPNALLLAAFVAIEAILIAVLWIARTDRAIVSPWDVLPSSVFILYGLASFFLMLTLRVTSHRFAPFVVLPHALTTWGVALMVYALGFGYDPFVHQATEAHIIQNGFILPKQPFYIGQYVLVAALWTITRLPVHVLDALLVPVLAVLTAPVALTIGLRHGWVARRENGTCGLAAIFLVPLAVFTFTIPFNLASLFLLIIVCLLPLARDTRTLIALWTLALAALATHPLLGLPAIVLVAATTLTRRSWVSFVPAVLIPATLLGAMALYAAMNGATLLAPSLGDVGDSLRAIFGMPYDLAGAPWTFAALYTLEHWWPLVIAVFGFWTMKTAHGRVMVASAVGLLLSAIGLAVFIRLPGIIANEQFEFPLRLIATIPLMFIPAVAAFIGTRASKYPYATSVCVAILMTGAWYFSYPQQNAVADASSPGVGRDDVGAVQLIDRSVGPYVVLSHQMLGAAALRRDGFSNMVATDAGVRNAYAIPTGSELYGYYLRLWTDDPATVIAEARDFANVRIVFVAIPDAWDPDGRIRNELSALTKNVSPIGGLTLFTFTRDD